VKTVFHEDRLISALNKYWRPVTEYEYWHKMDIPATNNAISISQFPENVEQWIWERHREAFSIF